MTGRDVNEEEITQCDHVLYGPCGGQEWQTSMVILYVISPVCKLFTLLTKSDFHGSDSQRSIKSR